MTFDMDESKKKIDGIHACFYKFYNEYADATRVQPSVVLSELTYDFNRQSDISSVFFFNLNKIKFSIYFFLVQKSKFFEKVKKIRAA